MERLKCQKCKRRVDTVWGNGEYPNDSYRCQKCLDSATGVIVGGFLFLFLVGVAVIVAAGCLGWIGE